MVKPEVFHEAGGTFVLSNEHARQIEQNNGFAGPFLRAQNGVDISAFPVLDEKTDVRRDVKKVIYASSPDRGLVHLLRIWPLVVETAPDATLDIYYSWDMLRARARRDLDAKNLLAELDRLIAVLAPSGVRYLGGVSHPVLHEALLKAGTMAYFCTFEEISCIVAMKAQVAGCLPVVRPYAALSETVHYGRFGLITGDIAADLATFQLQLIDELRNPTPFQTRKLMSDVARGLFSWAKAADKFEEILLLDLYD